jgi:hypothetical protein
MLRSAGFESYPAMTMAGSRIEDIPVDQFNHCVSLVKLKSGYYKILDPTWVPFVRELWSSAEQQQNYLPGIPGGADLQRTPISKAENHYINIDVHSNIDEDGNLQASIKLVAEGQSDASFRSPFVYSHKSSWKEIAESLLLNTDIKMRIDSLSYTNPYDYSQPFELHAEISIPSYAVMGEKEIFYKSLAANLFTVKYSHLRINTSSASRKYDFKDRCSRQINIKESAVFAKGIEISYAPKASNISSPSSSFKAQYVAEASTVKFDLQMNLEKRIYKKEDWGDFRNCVEAHRDFIKETLILKIK